MNQRPLQTGIETIRGYQRTLPRRPGVYRMIDQRDAVLYVGKAKDLKARVASYTRPASLSNRIARMVAQTVSMNFIETETEAGALLVEASLIKKLKPRFNILLRDDKSFPYILLRDLHKWPQITKHRGAQTGKGQYFGPFASAGAVNRTLNTLQKVFLLRSCSDSVLEHRSRPCLLYQIKRCSAPCVERISPADYQELVNAAAEFLRGRNSKIQKRLACDMQKASDNLEYEAAAALRDRLHALTQVQTTEGLSTSKVGDADVFAIHREAGQTSVQVFFFRAGQNWGNRSYFPRHEQSETDDKIIGAFLTQFYDSRLPVPAIYTNVKPEAAALIEEAFSSRAERVVRIYTPVRGRKKKLVDDAAHNAAAALERRLAETASHLKLLEKLAEKIDLEAPPERIEVYDNSHMSGTHPVGAMIVADREGLRKKSYRKFNIKTRELSPGDDYGMMREVLTRRLSRLVREDPDRESGNWPDLIILDGGRGQLNAVIEVLGDLGIEGLPLLAVAKGADRNAGREKFHLPGRPAFMLKDGSPVLFFIQRLRDEAHRFAIGTHRARRQKTVYKSALDGIPGIGPKRKRALLHHFGSAKAVESSGVKDLQAVVGISSHTAQSIYDYFNDNG